MRVGMSLAMISVFVIALSIPEAYEDLPGGWHGPLVLVLAYTLVRVIHFSLYLVAAGDDRELRNQVLLTQAVAMAPAVTALIVGALVGGPAQTWIWLGAFLYDFVLTYASSRGGGRWRIYSVGHWAERHGLIVILALGESIVAIGVGVAREPIDGAVVVGAALAVTLSILLWWSYFGHLQAAGEHELERRTDAGRVLLGMNAYTYLPPAIIGGVILAALGVEEAMTHIGDAEPFGWFAASVLGSGLAVYTAATAVFAHVVGLQWPWVRVLAAVALAASIPLLAVVASMWALTIVVAVLAAMFAIEGQRNPSAWVSSSATRTP
jgi:low temperature requirement protein LtrA